MNNVIYQKLLNGTLWVGGLYYHKLSGLKSTKLFSYSSGCQTSEMSLTGLRIKASAGLVSSGGLRWARTGHGSPRPRPEEWDRLGGLDQAGPAFWGWGGEGMKAAEQNGKPAPLVLILSISSFYSPLSESIPSKCL